MIPASAALHNPIGTFKEDDLRRIVTDVPFFEKVFDAFPVLVIVKSACETSFGQILIWNKFAAELTGISREDALGHQVGDYFPEEQRQFFEQKDRETMGGCDPLVIPEEPIQNRQGQTRWLSTTKTPIFDNEGSPLAILIVSQDITERREMSQVLHRERDLMDGILTNAPVGILVKSLLPETRGRYLIWNRAMERMFRLPADAVIGNTSVDVFDPVMASIFNEQDLRASLGGNLNIAPLVVKVEQTNLTIRAFKTRIDDANGKPLALVGVIENVTEVEKISEHSRETESRWQFAIAASDVGVWDWNPQTREVFLSQRMLELMRAPVDFQCNSLIDLERFVHPEYLAGLKNAMGAHLRGETDVFRAELRLRCEAPDEVWLLLNGKAQISPSGEPTRAIGTVADISSVKLAEQQMAVSMQSAESANRAKGDFLAMMSHEIRTPLNGVLGFADLLAESKLNDQQREFLQTIRDSGGALLAIINDILDYSKIEAGKLDVDLKPTDVRQIVQSLIAFFHPQAEKKGIELRLQIHSSVPTLMICDPVRVRQIILNLMGNALKFTSRGYVEFDLLAEPSTRSNFCDLSFYVKDSGIGISEANQCRLFEPFNQLDATTARQFGGTGLGLSIVKRLSNLMGGTVRVESVVGAGTTFFVTLPCQLVRDDFDPRKTMLIQLDITPDFAKSRPLKILVAEDNLVNRKLARLLLQKFGYSPDEAEDGSRAVAMALEKNYDLILMDIQMPGMDGYEAAQRIRELCPQPPQLVALTAHALKSDEARSREEGMDGHLSKPIRADLLRKVLEKVARTVAQTRSSV